MFRAAVQTQTSLARGFAVLGTSQCRQLDAGATQTERPQNASSLYTAVMIVIHNWANCLSHHFLLPTLLCCCHTIRVWTLSIVRFNGL